MHLYAFCLFSIILFIIREIGIDERISVNSLVAVIAVDAVTAVIAAIIVTVIIAIILLIVTIYIHKLRI